MFEVFRTPGCWAFYKAPTRLKKRSRGVPDHSFVLESIGDTDRYTNPYLTVSPIAFSVKQSGGDFVGWIAFSIVSALLSLAIPVMQYSKHFN